MEQLYILRILLFATALPSALGNVLINVQFIYLLTQIVCLKRPCTAV